jgi:hypothetical protein
MPIIQVTVLHRKVVSALADGLRRAVSMPKSGVTVKCTGAGKSVSEETDNQGQCSFKLDNGSYSLTTRPIVHAGKTLKPARHDLDLNRNQSVVLELAENKEECYAILDFLMVSLADGSDEALSEAEVLIARVKNTYNNYGRLSVLKEIKKFEKQLEAVRNE